MKTATSKMVLRICTAERAWTLPVEIVGVLQRTPTNVAGVRLGKKKLAWQFVVHLQL